MRHLRKNAGLTQQELALRVNVTQAYISKLELGNAEGLTLIKLVKISKALNVCPYYLFIIFVKIPYNCCKNCFHECEQ